MILGLVVVGGQILVLIWILVLIVLNLKKNQNWQSEYPKNQLENHNRKRSKKTRTEKHWFIPMIQTTFCTIIDTTSLMCENGIHLDTHTKTRAVTSSSSKGD